MLERHQGHTAGVGLMLGGDDEVAAHGRADHLPLARLAMAR